MAPVVATPHGGDRSKVETFHHADAGKTRDKIGSFAGVSGRTVEKIAAVVEAAERENCPLDAALGRAVNEA